MNRIKWKVCGLRDNVDEVVALQPDYVGFIFYDKSPRYVGENYSMPDLDWGKIKKVGVFVNELPDKVYATWRKYGLDLVQLHGDESPQYCHELKQKGVEVVKAFQVDQRFDFEQLAVYGPVTDYFLFDAKTEQYGGSGKVFDWRLIRNYNQEKNYFLSGGISLENLSEVENLDLSKLHAVDVNSKFELAPGLKNVKMLERLKEKIIGTKTVVPNEQDLKK